MGQKNNQKNKSADSQEPVDGELESPEYEEGEEEISSLKEEVEFPTRVRLMKDFSYSLPHGTGNGCQLITIHAGKWITDPAVIEILLEHGAPLED